MQALKNRPLMRLLSAALPMTLMWIICCCTSGVQSLPLLVYFRDPSYGSNNNYNDNISHPPLPISSPSSSVYQRVPPILFPQARLLGDFATPQYMVDHPSSAIISKRNIAIGRGDGFRPGRR